MTILGLASIAGSPGVTTTAVAVGMWWPRPVLLIEADTSNVSAILPGLLRGKHDYSRSLSQVMLLHARGTLTAELVLDPTLLLSLPLHDLVHDPALPHPPLREGHKMWLIPAFDSLDAADGTHSLWPRLPALAAELDDAGVDVIVDFGRLSRHDPREPLIHACHRLVVVSRNTLPDLFRHAHRVPELTSGFAVIGRERHVALALIDTAPEISAADFQTRCGTAVVGVLPSAPRHAAAYSAGAVTRRGRRPYRAAIRALAGTLADHLADNPPITTSRTSTHA